VPFQLRAFFIHFFGENSASGETLRKCYAQEVRARTLHLLYVLFTRKPKRLPFRQRKGQVGWVESMLLDIPTLFVISTCVTAVLGLFLLFAWIQDRSIRALAWWAAAYFLGGLAAALWSMHDAISRALTVDVVYALLFVACGIIWTGARLFHGRAALPYAMFGGAILWLLACQSPMVHESGGHRVMLGSLVIASYTLLTAYELWRARAEHLFSRWPAFCVLVLHGVVFLLPIPLTVLLPGEGGFALASGWFPILALETLLFAIGTAFIILVMAKERSEHIHRTAASTDPLTGIANRRGFVEEAGRLMRKQAWKKQPVTALVFDLDHFKSINDRFGHAVGDEALRLFAQTATMTLRSTDVIGRLGGEEFAALLPGDLNNAAAAAERVRSAFAVAGAAIDGRRIGATVSIGAASALELPCELGALLARADAALYRAKAAGRNRLETDAESAGIAPPLAAADAPETRVEDRRAETWTVPGEILPVPATIRAANGHAMSRSYPRPFL
jgi:diguanylate cyclase (GGDEF)-like protein